MRRTLGTIITLALLLNSLPVYGQSLYQSFGEKNASNSGTNASSIPSNEDFYSNACKACDLSVEPGSGEDGDGRRVRKFVYQMDARPGYTESYENKDGARVFIQKVRFRLDDQVFIVIRNMNPFLFDYTIQVDRKAVVDTAHLAFLKFFSPLFSDFLPSGEEAKSAQGPGKEERGEDPEKGKDEGPSKTCLADAEQRLAKWTTEFESIKSKLKAKRGEVENIYTSFESVGRAYRKAANHLSNPQATCKDLCDRGREFLRAYQKDFPEDYRLEDLREDNKDLQNQASRLVGDIEEYLSVYGNCKPGQGHEEAINDLSKTIRVEAVTYANRTTSKVDRLRTYLCKNRSKFDGMKDAIEVVLSRPDRYLIQQLVVGEFDSSHTVDITIRRKPRTLNGGGTEKDCSQDEEARASTSREAGSSLDEQSSIVSGIARPDSGRQASIKEEPQDNTRNARLTTVGYFKRFDLGTDAAGSQDNASKKTKKGEEPGEEQDASKKDDKKKKEQQANGGGTSQEQPEQEEPPSERLNFGPGPRFTISGGIAVSPLTKRQFQNVAGFERDREGNLVDGVTLTNVITEKESSDVRIGPMVMLHTRLLPDSNLLHFSFGVTGKHDNAGTDIEYLFGPSLNILERKLFLTGGVYLGKDQKLAGDLFPGLKIDPMLSEVPVRKEIKPHFGFSITYRITNLP